MQCVSSAQIEIVSVIKAIVRGRAQHQGSGDEKETLERLLEKSSGAVLFPLIAVLLIPILIVVFFGMQILIAILIGVILAGLIKTYTMSNSCGILANVQDSVEKSSIKEAFKGATDALQAAMVGGSYGVGLREPYALAFVLFYKVLILITFYSFGLAESTSLLAKALDVELAKK
eukprot:TRINITY_DN0_c216_g1_i1.p1 TRINITY_DN0_c216_g1~~TRINITY_DN0_c216_g1_i1.p1  ORF type:complete len:174 (-),score=49.86 TRINITY_DN0_c216_g1_i1:49-570(-)